MRLMVVRGNARENGYTEYITNFFVTGAKEAGAAIDDVRLTECVLKPCLGCYHCWTVTPGTCIHHDDGPDLLRRLLEADVVVCASPLYHYSISSWMKVFLERTFPLIAPGFDVTSSGFLANKLRHPEKWNKSLVVIAAGAFRELENFGAVRELFRMVGAGMSISIGGYLFRPESFLLPFHFARPKTVKAIETAFVQAGMEAARTGTISQEIQDRVAVPLSADHGDFQKYSSIYWEHAVAMGKQEWSAGVLEKRVMSDVRILMHEMARNLNPEAAARVRAVLQFDFPDEQKHFRIAVDRGTCAIEEAMTERPDLRITCDTGTWARLFMREINPREAVLAGEIRLEGDKSLFARLDRFFPPPAG